MNLRGMRYEIRLLEATCLSFPSFRRVHSIHILFAILFFQITSPAYAATPEEQFKNANEAYRAKKYVDATSAYESIVMQGYKSAPLFYNLGNAYYRQNRVPQAILNYERAKALSPADEDIQHNIKLANLGVTDKIEPLPEFGLFIFAHNFLSLKTSSGWSVLSVIFMWLSLLAAALYLFTRTGAMRKTGFYTGIACLILAGVFYICATQRNAIEERRFAIIYAPVSYVKTSPEDKGQDAFYIHAGTKVEVKDNVGEWINIRLADGKSGWIKKDEAEVI
jgi:tetratricopeptide (TPR) repeat protein